MSTDKENGGPHRPRKMSLQLVPSCEVTDEDRELMHSLKGVAKQAIPEWYNLHDDEIKLKKFTGGVTNILYGATFNGLTILLRIYGNATEIILDRDEELKTLNVLYEMGVGPKIYLTFNNGYAYEYFDGKPLTYEDLISRRFNSKIGQRLGEWHKKDIPPALASPDSKLWATIDKWYQVVPQKYTNPKNEERSKSISLEKIHNEYPILKEHLSALNSPLVLCHNDLLGPNIVYNEKKGDKIDFIDYEYSAQNYRAFDIANHFNEWAGFKGNYENYPNKEAQYEFYRAYLRAFKNAEPSQEELDQLYVEVNKFTLASHFFWGTWSLVQAEISTIDFDFMEYGLVRWNQYWKTRDYLFALNSNNIPNN